MGLEDRDWYREKPSEAWRERWSGRTTSGPEAPANADAPDSFLSQTIRPGAAAAIIVSAVVTGLTWHLDLLHLRGPAPRAQTVVPIADAAPQPPMEVRLNPRPELGRPVAQDTTWTVTDPRFGTLSIVVPAGRAPLGVIARELSVRGYQVTLPAPLTG